jgi:hypothetical protein
MARRLTPMPATPRRVPSGTLPLEKLLGAELHGVRLVVPAAADGNAPGDQPH